MLGDASPDMMGYWGASQKSTAANVPLMNGRKDGQLRFKKVLSGTRWELRDMARKAGVGWMKEE